MGAKAPADVRILQSNNLMVDNSSFTGEAEPLARCPECTSDQILETKNMVFSSTNIVNGSATGLVVATGDGAMIGRIAGLAAGTGHLLSPIKSEVNRFVKIISAVALIVGVIFFLIGLVKYPLLENLLLAISICVANVPEGLLATVTAALTNTANRMAKCNVLVKSLDCVETLGSCNTICSDKTGMRMNHQNINWLILSTGLSTYADLTKHTLSILKGTLTQNKMTAQHVCFDLAIHSLGRDKSSPFCVIGAPVDRSYQHLLRVAALCSRAYFSDDWDVRTSGVSTGVPIEAKDSEEDTMPLESRLLVSNHQQNRPAFGDATEVAILRYCDEISDVAALREDNPKIEEVPFNSKLKYQISIHNSLGFDSYFRGVRNELQHEFLEYARGRKYAVKKGAPECIIDQCATYLRDGCEAKFTEELRNEAHRCANLLAARGERVLGFSRYELRDDLACDALILEMRAGRLPDADFCFVGLISLIDPPRESVAQAIKECRSAKIKIIMVTGDHPTTGVAIARQVNIFDDSTVVMTLLEMRSARATRTWEAALLNTVDPSPKTNSQVEEDDNISIPAAAGAGRVDKYLETIQRVHSAAESQIMMNRSDGDALNAFLSGNGIVVTGEELKSFSAVDWDEVLAFPQIVFARTAPQQKLIIVEELQKRGSVVAVTGDGVNDSPALKAANIGVAMGLSGSEISKDVASIILLDDEFMSIVLGIAEGRLIFDNLKKSIAYTLQHLGPEVLPILLFFTIEIPLPLTTVLILLIDLGTDLFPAISFCAEKPETDIMIRPPRSVKVDKLVGWRLFFFAYVQIGLIQSLGVFTAYFVAFWIWGINPSDIVGTAPSWNNETWKLVTSSGRVFEHEQRQYILKEVQTATFVSIVIVQLGGLFACKTRILSVISQGVFGNSFMNKAIAAELILTVCLIYIPSVQSVVGTVSLRGVLWLPAIPFAVAVLLYDELRKCIIRKRPKGWVAKLTLY